MEKPILKLESKSGCQVTYQECTIMVTPLLRPKNRSLLTRLSQSWQLVGKSRVPRIIEVIMSKAKQHAIHIQTIIPKESIIRKEYKRTWATTQSAFMKTSKIVWQVIQHSTWISSYSRNQAIIKAIKEYQTWKCSHTRFFLFIELKK